MQFNIALIASAILMAASPVLGADFVWHSGAGCAGTVVARSPGVTPGECVFLTNGGSAKSISYSGVTTHAKFFESGGAHDRCTNGATITTGAGSGCANGPAGPSVEVSILEMIDAMPLLPDGWMPQCSEVPRAHQVERASVSFQRRRSHDLWCSPSLVATLHRAQYSITLPSAYGPACSIDVSESLKQPALDLDRQKRGASTPDHSRGGSIKYFDHLFLIWHHFPSFLSANLRANISSVLPDSTTGARKYTTF
ncbi:hypothetical protein FB45DRAFT_869354 [Roridomyces roridus]|uniref:Uncharacterized protein n=1 Tax=Roridomyces roridus TaxID=1738132 RepID=A0AAD7BL03_9AGAR|nr:hypothetical protein FB45DRAFT_869354 [Roridomyces roridus]